MNNAKNRAFPSGAISDDYGGMTKREWFAGMALPALIARHRADVAWSEVAPRAYEIADAMLTPEPGPVDDMAAWRHSSAFRDAWEPFAQAGYLYGDDAMMHVYRGWCIAKGYKP